MKYLSDYISQSQTDLFEKYKVFFAFSDKQLQEGLDKHGLTTKDIYSLGMGMLCPKKHADAVVYGLKQIVVAGIKQDIAENGLDAIIDRELGNHEAWYTGDIESTVEALSDYPGITVDRIQERHQRKYYSPVDNMNHEYPEHQAAA